MTHVRKLFAREDVNYGSAERPLAPGTIEDKFLANAMRVMSRDRASALRELLLALDEADDVGRVAAQLGGQR